MPEPLAQNRVLLVDDDPSILRILVKALELEGYQVEPTCDPYDALHKITNEPPDILITDWDMPGMTGIDLCRRVRQADLPHYVYVMFLTGKSSQQEMIAGLEAGADDFLTKPLNRGELVARLRAGSRVLDIERRLSRQAYTDVLTGIASRRSFSDVGRREFDRARRYASPMSCVMLDVDYFKRVNDVFGHAAGDVALQDVARTLVEHCRASDFPCRYGGEEFAVLLPETREADATIWANRVREAIAGMRLLFNGKVVMLTASLGVAQLTDDVESPDQLINLADQALLVAKKAGRNRVVSYSRLYHAAQGEREVTAVQDVFRNTLARDIMSTPVASVSCDCTVGQAAEYFLRYRINSAPVIGPNGRAVGILSEQDCMAAMISADGWNRLVQEVMSRNVVCFDEFTPVRSIHEFFCRVTLRRVIIVRGGEPCGVISRSTLMRWLQHWAALRHGWRSASETGGFDDEENSHRQLMQGIEALGERVQSLKSRLEERPDHSIPVLLDGTTQIQELCTDLLARARGPATQASLSEMISPFL